MLLCYKTLFNVNNLATDDRLKTFPVVRKCLGPPAHCHSLSASGFGRQLAVNMTEQQGSWKTKKGDPPIGYAGGTWGTFWGHSPAGTALRTTCTPITKLSGHIGTHTLYLTIIEEDAAHDCKGQSVECRKTCASPHEGSHSLAGAFVDT